MKEMVSQRRQQAFVLHIGRDVSKAVDAGEYRNNYQCKYLFDVVSHCSLRCLDIIILVVRLDI